MGVNIKTLATKAYNSIKQRLFLFDLRIFAFSAVAVIGFPLYYYTWHDIFPQPYENLPLRLIGSALFLPFMFTKHWPSWMHRHMTLYWYLAILYALPFFFIFMLLKNDGSTVWLLSTLIAIFLMIQLLDWVNLLIQFCLGAFLASLAYYATGGGQVASLISLESLPIYLFAIILGSITNYSAEVVQKERLCAMLATASNIAHELRTPLLGIKAGAVGLQRYLPPLFAAYQMAQEQGLPVEHIRLVHLNSMHRVLDRIESEADHSNAIIDMLLMNTRTDRFRPENLSSCSVEQCLETAIQRYPFASEKEKQLVVRGNKTSFNFQGIELLMVHVLFNLLKNALYYIAKAGKGEIFIYLNKTSKENTLIFKDTGSGIPPEVLPHIFTCFYSWSPGSENDFGTGIGLAFCRSVMTSFGGSIHCESQLGEYTQFILTFPPEKPL